MRIGQIQLGSSERRVGLSNNQLKIIAMICMVCDHVGKALLPGCDILFVLGRLAFPIFAYMIAEGCRHTKHKARYFMHLAFSALVFQLVYFFVMGSLYMSVFVTFSLSVLIIFSIDFFVKKRRILPFLLMVFVFFCAIFLTCVLPELLPKTDFAIDYELYGVLFPVLIFCLPNAWTKLAGTAVMLLIKVYISGKLHWYGFLALPLLLLYNGERGKARLKYMFYVFYPAHLVVIYLLQLLIHALKN